MRLPMRFKGSGTISPKKREDELREKYLDPHGKALSPKYLYLQARLEAVEKAIVKFCGDVVLKEVMLSYN